MIIGVVTFRWLLRLIIISDIAFVRDWTVVEKVSHWNGSIRTGRFEQVKSDGSTVIWRRVRGINSLDGVDLPEFRQLKAI
jgi:hypothetical protein